MTNNGRSCLQLITRSQPGFKCCRELPSPVQMFLNPFQHVFFHRRNELTAQSLSSQCLFWQLMAHTISQLGDRIFCSSRIAAYCSTFRTLMWRPLLVDEGVDTRVPFRLAGLLLGAMLLQRILRELEVVLGAGPRLGGTSVGGKEGSALRVSIGTLPYL